jgi:two-component system chemotaxis response regulator CheY
MIPKETVFLVVDDMGAIRDLVKAQLKANGYNQIRDAENGAEAFQIFNNSVMRDAAVGFIVSDWNMPKMTGIELLKKVRATDLGKNVPFLLLTSENEKSQVTEAVLAGVSNYIVKPFSPKTFQEKLLQAWSKHKK